MQKNITLALVLLISWLIVGCATSVDPTKNPPGFLPDYSRLKPLPTNNDSESMQIYSYKDPTVNRKDYHAALIESVTLYQKANPDGVTNEQIEQVRLGVESGIRQVVSKRIAIVNKPESGAFTLAVAITGATVEQDGFHPWNFIPISAAIKLATMATGINSKKVVLVVEMKYTDSKSGKLLKEVVAVVNGEDYRLNISTAEEFQQIATIWVQQALLNSAEVSYDQ